MDALEPAEHKDLGPVLIAAFFNGTPPVALVYTTRGLIKRVPIDQLSVPWHWGSEKGWERDFPEEG